MLNYLQNGRCYFIFTTLLGLCIQPPLQYPPKISSSTSVNFHIPIPPFLVHKIIITIPTITPFLYFSAIFPLFFLCKPSQQSIPKLLSLSQPLSQFGLHQGTKELGSLVTTGTVLIFPFFLRLWTVITGFTIFLIAQAQKMCVLKVVVSDKDACNRNGKPFSHPFLIPSSYCYYFHTILIPSQELTFVWEPFF